MSYNPASTRDDNMQYNNYGPPAGSAELNFGKIL